MLTVVGNNYSCGTFATVEQIAKLQACVNDHIILDPREFGVIESCVVTTIDANASNVEQQVRDLSEPEKSKKTDKKFLGGHLKNIFDGKPT
jgi:hypothetical protein